MQPAQIPAQIPAQQKVMNPVQPMKPAPPSPAMFRPAVQQMAPVPPQPMFMPAPVAVPPVANATPVAQTAAPVPAPNLVSRPQVMTPGASPMAARPPMTYAPGPQVTPSSARPKPERMTTSLSAELQQVQLADSEVAGAIDQLISSLIGAMEQRSAGTPDERFVRDTAGKLDELRQKLNNLPSECAGILLSFLKDVESKDSSSAQKNLEMLTRDHSKSLSSTILTGLRFLMRLSAKLL